MFRLIALKGTRPTVIAMNRHARRPCEYVEEGTRMSNRHFAAMRTILGVQGDQSGADRHEYGLIGLAHSGRHHRRRHALAPSLNTTFNKSLHKLK